MKTITRLSLLLAFWPVFAILSGCGPGGSPTPPPPPAPGFTLQYTYGHPGAIIGDPYVLAHGQALYPLVPCTVDCYASFQGHVDPNGLIFVTTGYINGQNWEADGNATPNCSQGYAHVVQPLNGDTYGVMCADQTAYFKGSPVAWYDNSPPSSVTYSATSNVFPGSGYVPSIMVYDTSGNVNGQGSGTSSSSTTLNMRSWAVSKEQNIVIVRNPSTNQVIGAGAYRIIPSNPNCNGPASPGADTVVKPGFRCPTCCT